MPYFADPTKEYIRKNGNVEALQDNLNEYFGLYIELGVEHPLEYIKAWIDETRGYWNGGYNYWRWEQGVVLNDLGIYREYPSEMIHRLMCEYLWLWQRIPLLIPFLCIGLQTWLIMLVMNEGIVRGDKVIVAMTLPLAINILTLMLATPVFAEFRYAYSSFLCVPFLFLTCVRRE
ncbi:DUF6020 family protein [Butyrivibrio sp. INlla18]|uniref:DUF6020 family protein n=1 Tax=Butyrivibrio sp. INlla18 TaxID=1520806 RepID=UPI002E8E2F0B|nr:DUF6020 family protein [Butyrivibrio sp. INlla18]